jgi:hypothetical protein
MSPGNIRQVETIIEFDDMACRVIADFHGLAALALISIDLR